MYTTGHITPWWGDEFKSLDYKIPELTNTYDVEKWNKMGFSGYKYGGGIYNMQNKMPDYAVPFLTLFDWNNVAIQFFILKTMWAVPPHSDGFPGYMKRNNITDINRVCRAVVFLEDWKSGHYLEMDGDPFVNWKAGDWVQWCGETPHYAANIGLENRYTLQITGNY